MEHGLTNGFIPYSSGFKPSANAAYAAGPPQGTVHPQAPSVGESHTQKAPPASTDASLPTSNLQVISSSHLH